MKIERELKDGAYIVGNGDDCDNLPYEALLVIMGNKAFISEFSIGLNFESNIELKKVELQPGEDLFKKLGIVYDKKI